MKIPVLSANIYDESGENYVKPYIIHNETREGKYKGWSIRSYYY